MTRLVARALLPLLLAGCVPPAAAPPAAPTVAADAWAPPALPPARAIAPAEYAARRAALAARMETGALVVLGSPEPAADYLPFAQGSHFRYLTGIDEAGAALLILKRDGRVEEQLFVRDRNPAREVWEGPRLGTEGARARTGIATRSVERLPAVVDSVVQHAPRLYLAALLAEPQDPLAPLPAEQQLARRWTEERAGAPLVSLDDELQRLRAVKSAAELDLIRRAVYITTLAHRAAMRAAEPGLNEFELQALIEYTFRRYGADRPAFATIVGSGPNSTTLHYRADDRFTEPGETVVMDIGASYRGYAADVTRTIPVSGTFSPEQREIYSIVLAAQKAAEAQARPGATWDQLNAAAHGVVAEGLARLGLIESPTATYACGVGRCPQHRLFFMHGLGHGIGLDVHDPDVSYFEPFRVGSAFTIEPGVYVRADALDHLPDTPENRALVQRLAPVVQRYRNIGVRIEDDYFITADGVERVSSGAPREIDDIEALMSLPAPGAEGRLPEVVEWYRASQPR